MVIANQLKDLKKRFPAVQSAIDEGTTRGAALLGNFTKQLNGYEKRVKSLVGDLEVRKEEARNIGKAKLERLVDQIRTTRTQVEKTVTHLVEDEKKKLNGRLEELLGFLNKTDRPALKAAAKKTTKKRTAKKASAQKAAKSASKA